MNADDCGTTISSCSGDKAGSWWSGLGGRFVERLWRSVKYECLYLHGFATVPALTQGLTDYFDFYRHERPHQALDYSTPAMVYGQRAKRR